MLDFAELRKVDVTPYVMKRDGVDYLPWTAVVDLLHSHGAKKVWYEPFHNVDGSSLFMSEQVFTDSKGNTNRCYEVRIEVIVDDDTFTYTYPILNGINPVKDNAMNQNVLHKAIQRAAVKAVAIRYGLGFSLWAKGGIEDDDEDDIYKHNIFAIKERFQQEYTKVLREKNLTTKEIAEKCYKTEEEIRTIFTYFEQLDRFEKQLLSL